MSDYIEFARAWNEIQKTEKARRWEENLRAVVDAGLPYQMANNDRVLLFRDKRGPKVDFYPSTNTWRDHKAGKTLHGTGRDFVAWYRKRYLRCV